MASTTVNISFQAELLADIDAEAETQSLVERNDGPKCGRAASERFFHHFRRSPESGSFGEIDHVLEERIETSNRLCTAGLDIQHQ